MYQQLNPLAVLELTVVVEHRVGIGHRVHPAFEERYLKLEDRFGDAANGEPLDVDGAGAEFEHGGWWVSRRQAPASGDYLHGWLTIQNNAQTPQI